MPITATCPKCRKQLKVRDELVGKKLKCPGCGGTFTADASTSATAARVAAHAANKKSTSKVSISWGPILIGVGVLLVIGGILAFIFGPKRVHAEWQKQSAKANDDIVDVMNLGLQSYLSHQGEWNPNKGTGMPHAEDPMFIFDPFVMSMPSKVPFKGGSTHGTYQGKYNPQTGEVEADCEIGGGISLSGKVQPGHTKIHVTGRRKNNEITAEVDGKKAAIHYPPKDED